MRARSQVIKFHWLAAFSATPGAARFQKIRQVAGASQEGRVVGRPDDHPIDLVAI